MLIRQFSGRLGRLALARWAGWSGVQVGRHVKVDLPCWKWKVREGGGKEQGSKWRRGTYGRREWNRGGDPKTLS